MPEVRGLCSAGITRHQRSYDPVRLPSETAARSRRFRIVTFEACSGFAHVTAHRIAQPPKATFVTRLQPSRLPNQAARQLTDLSTSIRVDPPSTGNPRRQGAMSYSVFMGRGSGIGQGLDGLELDDLQASLSTGLNHLFISVCNDEQRVKAFTFFSWWVNLV